MRLSRCQWGISDLEFLVAVMSFLSDPSLPFSFFFFFLFFFFFAHCFFILILVLNFLLDNNNGTKSSLTSIS